VQFFAGSAVIATDTVSPYTATWNNAPAGTYALKAVVTMNGGATVTSNVATVTVVPATQQPTASTTWTLSVVNGSGDGTYASGTQVTISANVPAGQTFARWTGASVTNATSATTTLVMPAANTTVTATFNAVSTPSTGTVAVPYVVGQTFVAASTALQAAGLKATAVNPSAPNNPQDGIVGTESPSSGSMVAIGSVVTLTMTDPNPPLAPTPSVTSSTPPSGPPPPPSKLIQLSDFGAWHVGSFNLPAGVFGYSKRGMAYNASHNSLVISTIDVGADVAEVSVPAVGGTATLLHGTVDPFEGKINSIGGNAPAYVGGMFIRNDGSMIVSAYDFYDGSGGQTGAFFTRPGDLSQSGKVAGAFPAVGAPTAKFAAGYFGSIPAAWQPALGGDLLAGMCCTNIISTSSFGPSVGAMQASDVGAGNRWNPLVYYTSANPLQNTWNVTSDIFNGTTEVTGVCFPEGTDTVIFVGRQGIGTYSYGTPGQDAGSDPADSNKGNHAYPYRHQVWLYDAHDLAAVRAGTKQPYQLRPYAYGLLGGMPQTNGQEHTVGCAYNAATKQLYIGQAMAAGYEGAEPVIHVYQVR